MTLAGYGIDSMLAAELVNIVRVFNVNMGFLGILDPSAHFRKPGSLDQELEATEDIVLSRCQEIRPSGSKVKGQKYLLEYQV